jgi:hypothetical protein
VAEQTLEELTNLDAEAAGLLREAGIETPEALRGAGAIGAFLACADAFDELRDFELMFRLEGAIRGVPWQEIPEHDLVAMRADATTALDMGEF